MPKPNSSMTVAQMKAYIRQHKVNHPEVKLGMKRGDMIAGLKKAGHWDDSQSKKQPPKTKKTPAKKKAVPKGSHRMPDGSIMKDKDHKGPPPKKAPAKKKAPVKKAPAKKKAPVEKMYYIQLDGGDDDEIDMAESLGWEEYRSTGMSIYMMKSMTPQDAEDDMMWENKEGFGNFSVGRRL